MKIPLIKWSLLLATALLLWPAVPSASVLSAGPQEATQAQPTQEGAQEPVQPELIGVAEIPSRAEIALALAAEAQTLVQPRSNIVDIETRLPDAIAAMDLAYDEFAEIDLEIASVRRIRDLSQVWTRNQTSLTAVQSTLVPRREDLQASVLNLRDAQALWERTVDSLVDIELPEGVGERVAVVLESLESATESVESRLATLLTLETRASEQLQRANDVLSQLYNAEATARQRLLVRDTAPLWSLASQATEGSLLAQATDTYYGSAEAMQQFLTAEIDGFVLHVALFIGLLLVLAILKRWSRSWEVDSEALERAKFVLSRPFATATLLALIATERIYEPVPDVVREVTLILTLIPVLLLLAGIFKPVVRPGLYGFLCLFFFAHILALIPEGSLLYRLVLLIVATAGVATFMWFLRRPPWPHLDDLTASWRGARRCLQLGAFLLGISAVGNFFGWLRLASLLVSGTFYSAYGAVLIYVLWATLTGILAALPFTPLAAKLRSLEQHGPLITQRASTVIGFVGLFLWLRGVTRFFDIYEPLSRGLISLLEASAAIGSLSISLGKVITVVLILWLARLLSQFIRFIMKVEVFPRLGMQVGEAEAAATLTQYVIGAIAIVTAAAAIGVTGTQIAMLIGAMGVGIGFGLQSIVNNFISGLILIFERPIKVGDMVEVGQLLGTVKRIGIRASVVRTFDGAEVVVPNGDLISKEVVNWTLSDQVRRRELRVGVEYGNEPEQVLELLAKVASDHPEVFDTPEPMILFQGFDDGMMNFSLRYWVPIAGSLKVASEVAVAVNAALREAGIKIPVPQREIFVHTFLKRAGVSPGF